MFSAWLAGFIESKVGGRCEMRCLCDNYLPFFYVIAYNPLSVLGIAILLWIIFIAIFGPLWLASFAVSTWGALLLLAVGIVWLARFVARSMAFPGAVKSMQKVCAQTFFKRNTEQLEELGNTAASFTKQLMLVASNNRISSASMGMGNMGNMGNISIESMTDLKTGSAYLASIASCMRDALTEELSIERNDQMAAEARVELEPCQQLIIAADGLAAELQHLYNIGINALNPGNTAAVAAAPPALLTAAVSANTAATALRKAAAAARPSALEISNSSSAPGERRDLLGGGIASTLHGIWTMNSGATGSARLSFGIMRAQLKSVFRAERELLLGDDGNTIDLMYIPNIRSSERLQQGDSGLTAINDNDPTKRAAPAYVPSTVGTVFLCGPNAGLYELVSQMHQESSWFGFYQRLGFDVCCWNYRGYNSSTGTPSPAALKRDAEVIIHHLRQDRGVKDLLVHGESIGGMIACHVAAHVQPPPRLLVADRTFASLDSVAEKLLGKWASFGLRYLGLWHTNVVQDYCAATCDKLIIQDPTDSIIHDTASLKNGLSTHVILGDTDWYEIKLPPAYRKAELLNTGVQSVSIDASALLQEAHAGGIHEGFVVHLCACIQDVATRAAQDLRVRKAWRAERDRAIAAAKTTCAGEEWRESYTDLPVLTSEVKQIPLPPLPPQSVRTLSEIEACSGDSFSENVDFTLSAIDKSAREYDPLEGSTLDDLQAFAPLSNGAGTVGGEVGVRARSRSTSADVEDTMPCFMRSNPGIVPRTSNVSPLAPQLSPLERAWMLMCRTDGGSGSSLIQAWCNGVNGIRAWLCSAVVWSARAAVYKDYERSKATSQFVSFGQVSKELHTMIYKLHPGNNSLAQISSLCFVQEAFALLATRTSGTDIPEGQGPLLGPNLGLLVPVDCGHNGWPGNVSLQAISQCVHNAGFNMLAPDSAGARNYFPLAASLPKSALQQPARGLDRAGFVLKDTDSESQSNPVHSVTSRKSTRNTAIEMTEVPARSP